MLDGMRPAAREVNNQQNVPAATQDKAGQSPDSVTPSARLNKQTAGLESAPAVSRLTAQDMTAVHITEQAPSVPQLADVQKKIEASAAESLETISAAEASNQLDDDVQLVDAVNVPARDIARLKLCDSALKAMWALMPNGQGNQLRTIRLSNCRSHTALEVMRATNNKLGIDDSLLSDLCAAKEGIVKGTAISEDPDVEALTEKLSAEKAKAKKYAKRLKTAEKEQVKGHTSKTSSPEAIKSTKEKLDKAKAKIAELKVKLGAAQARAQENAQSELERAQAARDAFDQSADPNDEENKLTKRALAALTFGAGNCGDFSELAFYLITHGLCGDIPPDTPIYQLDLVGMDHNIVVLGELTDNPTVVDSWALVPVPHRLSECAFGDTVASDGQLADALQFTIVNHFPANQQPKPAFPQAIVEEYQSQLQKLYEDKLITPKASMKECVEDARSGEAVGVFWDHSNSAKTVASRYVSEADSVTFAPCFPKARVESLANTPATLRASQA